MRVNPEKPENKIQNDWNVINASEIDMSTALGMDNANFWYHHSNCKEDYMRIARKLPDVQSGLNSGKSLEELKRNPELADTVVAYYDPEKMIQVELTFDGTYVFDSEGRHRIKAAQELGYAVPVKIVKTNK